MRERESRRLCGVRSTSFLVCHRVAGVCARTARRHRRAVSSPLAPFTPFTPSSLSEGGPGGRWKRCKRAARSTRSSVGRGEQRDPGSQPRAFAGAATRENNGKTEARSTGDVRGGGACCARVAHVSVAHACVCARAYVRKRDRRW